MIIYSKNKAQFLGDVLHGIDDILQAELVRKTRRKASPNEVKSWRNSLSVMANVLQCAGIPDDVGIGLEYTIPATSKRIDLLITGKNERDESSVVVVELKQWESAEATKMDAVVRTTIGGGPRETNHPSYQAWSYVALLEDFNEAVRGTPVRLNPCAFLHNCKSGEAIHAPFYAVHTDRAPAFLKGDAIALQDFIRRHVRRGDDGHALYVIENGRISPSKSLADALSSMLKGNREFVMLDEQKLVFETVLNEARRTPIGFKSVVVVDGGPGTGKSVVAVNLLAALTDARKVVKYVTKNRAPRAVYESKLTGSMTKSRIASLFTGSGSYRDTKSGELDVVLVDEAHRLNEKSGLFQNLGENQVKELIHSARVAVFFLDEDQRIDLKDVGTKDEIRHWATQLGASYREVRLESQFRCNGSDGYLAWVDHTLQIRETANPSLDGINYDFHVCDDADELKALIESKNQERNRARIVAGYCWPWTSKKDPSAFDISIPNTKFRARWNLASDGGLWVMKPESVSEVGCIHTCQGLEMDYVGVILGPDLVVRDGAVVCRPEFRARADKTIHGYKKLLATNPDSGRQRLNAIIKNTYRTLMTRGMKGCFVHSVDAETNTHLRFAGRRAY